jgi:hypothetical protein
MNFLVSDITKQPNFPATSIGQRAQRAYRSFTPDGETLFQIIALQNCSKSLVDQLDELLCHEDVEGVGADRLRFGNRLVRQMNVEEDEPTPVTTINNATSLFKLTLQDCDGRYIYAIEQEKLAFLTSKNIRTGFPISLGAKLLVKDAEVVSECLLLKSQNVEYLGGVVPEWNADLAKRHASFLRSELDKL